MTSSLKQLSQFCSNFIWSLLRLGEWKIAKMVAVHRLRWPPCPYMVKFFENLLQNRGFLGVESLNLCTKWWPYIDLFYGKVKFLLSYAFVWANTFIWEKCCFKRLLLWSLWANVAQISSGASFGLWNESLLKKSRSIYQDAWPSCPYMVETFKNLLSQN